MILELPVNLPHSLQQSYAAFCQSRSLALLSVVRAYKVDKIRFGTISRAHLEMPHYRLRILGPMITVSPKLEPTSKLGFQFVRHPAQG
jgi:hypothetical protein